MNKEDIWKLQLENVQSGKEFIKEKPKRKRVMSGSEYLLINKKNKPNLKKKKGLKLIELLPIKPSRNNPDLATHNQILFINDLLKKSNKRYDYYYPRDKYILTNIMANGFINAIKNQTDFSFNMGRNEKKRMIQAYNENKKLDKDFDRIFNYD